MRGSAGQRALQLVVGLLGAVAVTAGTSTLLLGADSIVGGGTVSPTIDSELRFYAAWYVAAGVLLLRAVPRIEAAGFLIRVVGAALFVGASARVVSWLTIGRPHTFSIVLIAVEFTIPLILIPWQTAVARGTKSRRS